MELNKEKARFLMKSLRYLMHPVNCKIITLLEKERELEIKNIATLLNLPKPTVSQYLVDMKNGKILITKRINRKLNYSINPFFLDEFKMCVENCVSIEPVIK